MLRSALALTLLLVVAPMIPAPAAAQDHAGHGTVGTVQFPVSCTQAVQEQMHTAVAMLHSFWFPEARKAFLAVADADPGCGMAHWGVALTWFGNPMGGGSGPDGQARGAAAAERAVRVGARSARDSAYIAAVAALFRDHATVPTRTRMAAYEKALAELVANHPEDTEARIFHALAMIANAPPSDRTYARQHAAAEVLTALYRRHPRHPGLAHYIIHAFDAPSLAHHALDAARRYAEIAPAAPHALHMPSHTFTRLGYWDESIATNRRSADAESAPGAKAHPMDYMVYAYLQQGRETEARAVVAELGQAIGDDYVTGQLGSYNGRAMPARLALELEDWASAARLLMAGEDPPSVAAITRFARALGAARAGELDAARRENAALAAVVKSLADARETYWAHVVGAQHQAVSAWIAHLEGRHEEALRLARAAADSEDLVEKHPVTPGPLIPARELLGDILMLHGRFADALLAYEATLQREPRRLRTLYGAARAARAAGNAGAARKHYDGIRLLVHPESEHPARREAMSYLTGRASE